MDLDAHYQAFYDTIKAGLVADDLGSTPILAVHSQDSQVAEDIVEPPYVVYTEETARQLGTYGSGPAKVIMTGWRITVRTRDLDDLLAICTAIHDKFELEDVADTTDGYVTTAIESIGAQTLWEVDSKLQARHMRFNWERSK